MFPRKTALSITTLGALLLVLAWAGVVRAPVTIAPQAKPVAVAPTMSNPAPKPAVPNLTDDSHALAGFYRSLSARGVTRVVHYGDSPTTADSITADVRAILQERFGDAGHGFVLIAKPWAWYGHRGVEMSASGWDIFPASQSRAKDGLHGLGGVSFIGGRGATAKYRLATPHSRVEIDFLRQPGGGSMTVSTGDAALGRIDTAGDQKLGDYASFDLPPGTREVGLRVESGPVRSFGVSFEKPGPGIIYNSLGVNGGQVQMALRYFEKNAWAAALQHQKPDLVVINYGTNESVFAGYIDKYYAKELHDLIARVQAALPGTSVLIMSPMDRGERKSDGSIGTVDTIPKLVDIQRRTAAEMGCAFFDTFDAMGGSGTMGNWYAAQPRLVSADFMHPLPAGARKVGVLLSGALIAGYEQERGTKLITEKR